MTHSVFIDGAAGTTGLEIVERLAGRSEFQLLMLDDERRKSADARREAFHSADFAVLCLPDKAAVEAVALAEGSACRIIDASSAHRIAEQWTYGFPELGQRENIMGSRRVSNPGCYPTGFLALVEPLMRANVLLRDRPYSCHAVSGYSGGGKALIERFEDDPDIAYRAYALPLDHKHVAEMQTNAGLRYPPLFAPAVIPAYRGMLVEVPLTRLVQMYRPTTVDELRYILARFYEGSATVTVHADAPEEILLRRAVGPSDRLDLWVSGSADGERFRLVARLDNLGKGASGAAVQSLNLMAGLEETAGLRL